MDSVEYVSEGKLKELREELSRLKIKDRLEVSERIAHARSLGDLKENAEYHKAKDEQGFLESRIAELERIIKNAKIIEKENGEFVRLGSVVRLKKNNSPEETYEYQIVGS
ncbi:MAG TPA: transcription elongation factor GreA, partial [Candidatus Paceibacterota bacterium]